MALGFGTVHAFASEAGVARRGTAPVSVDAAADAMRSLGCPTRAALKQITKLEHPARSHLVHNHFGLFDKLRFAALEREAEGSRHPGRVRGTSGIRSVLDDLPILFVSGLNGGPFLADAARAARLAGLNRCCRRCRVGERQTVPGSACATALRWSHVPACRTEKRRDFRNAPSKRASRCHQPTRPPDAPPCRPEQARRVRPSRRPFSVEESALAWRSSSEGGPAPMLEPQLWLNSVFCSPRPIGSGS